MPRYLRFSVATAALAALQTIAAPLTSTLVLVAVTRVLDVPFRESYVALALVSALLCYIFMRDAHNEEWGTIMSGWTIARKTAMAWLAVVGVLLLIAYATKVSAVYSRRALFAWFLATPPILTAVLILLRQWLRLLVVRSGKTRSVVIAGVNPVSRQLAENLIGRPEMGLHLAGFFDDRNEGRLGELEHGSLLGRLSDLPNFVRTHKIDTIFVAIPLAHVQRTKDLLSALRDTTASIYFIPDIFVFDLIQARTDDLNGIPIVALCETPFHGWRGLAKRASDIVLAGLMLLIAAPALVVIALAVKLTSKGKVIFKQRRYGLDGEEITVYKFRTMTVTEDGDRIVQAKYGDERVTPIGRFLRRYSLDELPQLWNVLQGRMSVVGPRPHAVAHNEEYRKLIDGYMVRHKVAPGITGLAQVNGCRGETANIEDMERRVQYDLEYLRHWSLSLDLKILARTLLIWFRDDKAY